VRRGGEDVYVVGGGYEGIHAQEIFIVEDVATWTDGMDIPSRVPGTATYVSSTVTGDVPPTLVWSAPLVPRKYDIVVDVNVDFRYDHGVDALDDMDVNLAGFFVVPEYPLGTILGLAMCFAALAVFKSKSLRIHL